MITLCVIWNLEYHKLQGNTPNLTNQIKAGRIPESKKSLEIFERKLALIQAEMPAAFTGRFVPLQQECGESIKEYYENLHECHKTG